MRNHESAVAFTHVTRTNDSAASCCPYAPCRDSNATFAHADDRHPTLGLFVATISSLAIWAIIGSAVL